MKGIGAFFLIISYLVFLPGCTINNDKSPSLGSTVENELKTNTAQNTDKNIITKNCTLDDKGNLLILCEDEYELYSYDKFPDIPGKLAEIIQMLSEGDNIIRLDYRDKLSLYYVLEESKCQTVGGNTVDIFNFSIDKELDSVSFSVENLMFPDLLDDNYNSQLLETFNLLFSENGEDIYRYFMKYYQNPTDGSTDETMINGMRVTYKCTPKHQLVVYLLSDKDIQQPAKTPEQDRYEQTKEEDFVNSVMHAINQNDLSFLTEHYDSVYEEIPQFEIDALPGGLNIYHEHFRGDKLISFEYQKDISATYDTPNTTGKQYVFTSETGIKRDIIIKSFGSKDVTYKYNDPLLFYGEKTVNRVEAYIDAIQLEDIQYLYDYICIAYEEEESRPYTDPNRNEEYVALAEKTVDNYKNNFMLNTIEYKMSGNISEACGGSLNIEFVVTGFSSKNEAVEHIIRGTFEFPMWGINDSWFGNNMANP